MQVERVRNDEPPNLTSRLGGTLPKSTGHCFLIPDSRAASGLADVCFRSHSPATRATGLWLGGPVGAQSGRQGV